MAGVVRRPGCGVALLHKLPSPKPCGLVLTAYSALQELNPQRLRFCIFTGNCICTRIGCTHVRLGPLFASCIVLNKKSSLQATIFCRSCIQF